MTTPTRFPRPLRAALGLACLGWWVGLILLAAALGGVSDRFKRWLYRSGPDAW